MQTTCSSICLLDTAVRLDHTHSLTAWTTLKRGCVLIFLNLNESKTEIVYFFGKPSPAISSQTQGTLAPNIQNSAKNLGVILDSSFKFGKQVSAVVRNSYSTLELLPKQELSVFEQP